MECGHLNRYQETGKPMAFLGYLDVYGVCAGEVFLVDAGKKRSKGSPDFKVKARASKEAPWTEVGGAWLTKMDKGGECIGMQIDTPGMDRALNVTAFPDDEQPKDTSPGKPEAYTIKWKRPKQGGKSPAAADVYANDGLPW